MNVQGFYVRLHPACNKYYNFYTKDNNEKSVRERILQSIKILQTGIVPDDSVIKLNYKTQNIDDNFVFNGGLDKNTRFKPSFKDDERYASGEGGGYWYDINLDLIIDLPIKCNSINNRLRKN